MARFAHAMYLICVTLWVGGQWAIGYAAAPVLFAKLGDRALAGALAGQLFTVVAWVGLTCGTYLAVYLFSRRGLNVLKSSVFWLVAAMLLLTIASHFGIRPVLDQLKLEAFPREVMESLVRDRFAAWHGVSSALYLVQSVLGVFLVLRQSRI